MRELDELKAQVLTECRADHVGLWSVVREVREAFPRAGDEEVREITLAILLELLERRLVRAGLPTPDGRGFASWETQPAETIDGIDDAWLALHRDPDIGEIAWFTVVGEESAGPLPSDDVR